jgi:hypothetical protein
MLSDRWTPAIQPIALKQRRQRAVPGPPLRGHRRERTPVESRWVFGRVVRQRAFVRCSIWLTPRSVGFTSSGREGYGCGEHGARAVAR